MYQQLFDKSTNDGNRDQALSSIMNSHIAEGNYPKALEVNEQRIAIAEKAGDVQGMLGMRNLSGFINVEIGDLEAAAKQYEIGAKLASDLSLGAATAGNRSFNAGLQKARYLAARGEFDAARSELESVRPHLEKSRNINQERNFSLAAGYIDLKQKNFAKALEHFAKANSTDPLVWYYRAAASEGSGDSKAATSLYRRIATWNQLDTPGYALIRSKAVEKAKK